MKILFFNIQVARLSPLLSVRTSAAHSTGNKMSDLKKVICETITDIAGDLGALGDEIWRNPELAFEEKKAHALITDFLEKRGFSVERQYKIETAFRASFGHSAEGQKPAGPHVAILCEYDALPEIGHACGHNLIAEVGVAAGVAVKSALEATEEKLGQLTILGTPAEEGPGGKIRLINAGAFQGIDVAMMAHPSKKNLWRPKYLAKQGLRIKYHGKPSHASSAPWDGVNALDAAVLCYQSISCLRQQMKPEWRVHGIIRNGGVAANVIPEETELEYMVRATTTTDLNILMKKVVDCCKGAATTTGCKLDMQYDPPRYLPLLSNRILADLFEKNAAILNIQQDPSEAKYGGSTDMGDVSHIVPSIHPKFDIGTNASQHTREFAKASGTETAQKFTLAIAKAIGMTAVDIYKKPELLSKIQDDFKEDVKNEAAVK